MTQLEETQDDFSEIDQVDESDSLSRFFHSPVEFSLFIEQKAQETGMDILEYLTYYVEENSIDEDSIPPLLTGALKQKLMDEARKRYIMPRDDETQLEF